MEYINSLLPGNCLLYTSFEVNGIPMFAKGANYIPQDALLPNVTTERYQTLFRDMKEANMNMVPVIFRSAAAFYKMQA